MVASFLPHAAVRVLSRRELLRHPTFSVLAAEYSLGRHETHYGPGLDGGPAFTFIAPDVGEGAAQILFTLTRSPSGQVVVHAAVAGH